MGNPAVHPLILALKNLTTVLFLAFTLWTLRVHPLSSSSSPFILLSGQGVFHMLMAVSYNIQTTISLHTSGSLFVHLFPLAFRIIAHVFCVPYIVITWSPLIRAPFRLLLVRSWWRVRCFVATWFYVRWVWWESWRVAWRFGVVTL